jgi:hypothetical protein
MGRGKTVIMEGSYGETKRWSYSCFKLFKTKKIPMWQVKKMVDKEIYEFEGELSIYYNVYILICQ